MIGGIVICIGLFIMGALTAIFLFSDGEGH